MYIQNLKFFTFLQKPTNQPKAGHQNLLQQQNVPTQRRFASSSAHTRRQRGGRKASLWAGPRGDLRGYCPRTRGVGPGSRGRFAVGANGTKEVVGQPHDALGGLSEACVLRRVGVRAQVEPQELAIQSWEAVVARHAVDSRLLEEGKRYKSGEYLPAAWHCGASEARGVELVFQTDGLPLNVEYLSPVAFGRKLLRGFCSGES